MAAVASALRREIEEQGYTVVRGVVPQANLDAVLADLWQHVGADPADRESWYKPGIVASTGMVEMYQYQSMWDNRQHPALHATFAEILGSEKLWVTLDRVNLKPPADPRHPEHDHKGFLHWDTDIARYPEIRFGLQGVLALADTDETMGGFQCIPDLYRDLPAWTARRRAAGGDFGHPGGDDYPVVKVPARAGDIIIWSTLLPHGNGHNLSARPRLAQYISMHPARFENEEARQSRIRAWQECLPPNGRAFPGDPRRIEETRAQPAVLTPLGRRLLGLDPWE